LKKQSQFAGGQNGAILTISMVYGDFDGQWLRENKAKQSQTKPIIFSPQMFWGFKANLKKQSQFISY
jgi:hypothetical protein